MTVCRDQSRSGRLRRHLSFANVASGLSLFLVLSTGTAVALDGMNTVFSDDIVDGQVLTADIGTKAVTNSDLGPNAVTGPKIANGTIKTPDLYREPWQYVVANPQTPDGSDPCASAQTGIFCGFNVVAAGRYWADYGDV